MRSMLDRRRHSCHDVDGRPSCGRGPRSAAGATATVVGLEPWGPAMELGRANVTSAGFDDRITRRADRVEEVADEAAFDMAWMPAPFLPRNAVALLRVAAIAGDPFSATLVSTMADVAADDVTVGLDAAAAAGLIDGADPPAEFTFSHDLVREVVLESLDPTRRATLHHRAALAIEPRLRTDPSLHAVVADHLTRAGPEHAAATSAHWEQAARQAESMLAYEEAATSFGRAARTCVDDPCRFAELLIAQGDALLLAGNLDGARARFNDAANTARVTQNAELLARAVLGIGTGPVAYRGRRRTSRRQGSGRVPTPACRTRRGTRRRRVMRRRRSRRKGASRAALPHHRACLGARARRTAPACR